MVTYKIWNYNSIPSSMVSYEIWNYLYILAPWLLMKSSNYNIISFLYGFLRNLELHLYIPPLLLHMKSGTTTLYPSSIVTYEIWNYNSISVLYESRDHVPVEKGPAWFSV